MYSHSSTTRQVKLQRFFSADRDDEGSLDRLGENFATTTSDVFARAKQGDNETNKQSTIYQI